MNRPHPKSRSRFFAVAVTCAAVLVMLAPLRRGSHAAQPRQAGWLPLMNLDGLADTRAFHRLGTSASRDHASAEPLLRLPVSKSAP
jgi:hypothetical protein